MSSLETKSFADTDHVETPSTLKGESQARNGTRVGYVPVTAEEKLQNASLNRKLDIFLLPLLSLLYLTNGLDRGNVGNAETEGMNSRVMNLPLPFSRPADSSQQVSPRTLELNRTI